MKQIIQLNIAERQHDIQIKEYQGQRVITFRDIDELHQRPEGTASRNFSENKTKHFIKGEDYFYLTNAEIQYTKIVNYSSPKGLMLLTESGYLMLVKSLSDDLAWQVQRQLVNRYFRTQSQPTSLEDLIILQAQSVKELKTKVALIEEKTIAAHQRIDSMDTVNTIGDLQQRLNAMIRKYAQQEGLSFSKAWQDFVQSYNNAYRTNLNLLKSHYKMRNNIKDLTTPKYLSLTDKLMDAVRVADKLINKTSREVIV